MRANSLRSASWVLVVVAMTASIGTVATGQGTPATVAVVTAGLVVRLSAGEWCWVVLAIAIVWTAEALNTALEFLADVASPSFHPVVRDAKDVAAGAVLITAIAAAIIGGIVFWPHLAVPS